MNAKKFALSLLLGTSVVMLSACDKQEDKPESNASAQVTETTQSTQTEEKSAVKMPAESEGVKTKDTVKEVVAEAKENTLTTTENEAEPAKVKSVKKQDSEKQKMLRVLQQQYQQIRCNAEGEKLGQDSFCHQEERRLMSEIERLKQELR